MYKYTVCILITSLSLVNSTLQFLQLHLYIYGTLLGSAQKYFGWRGLDKMGGQKSLRSSKRELYV